MHVLTMIWERWAVRKTECQAWTEGYLIDRGMVDDLSDAASEHLPLLHEARIHIYLYDLMEWVHHRLGVRVNSHDMTERLLTLGWSPARFNVVVGGRRTTYRCWRCGGGLPTDRWVKSHSLPSH